MILSSGDPHRQTVIGSHVPETNQFQGCCARQRPCSADDPGDPGTVPRPSPVQPREQARSRRASGSRCAAAIRTRCLSPCTVSARRLNRRSTIWSIDRIRALGAGGFSRVVALSIVAFSIHRIGLLLRRLTIPGPPESGNRDLCPDTGNNRQIWQTITRSAASPVPATIILIAAAYCDSLVRRRRGRLPLIGIRNAACCGNRCGCLFGADLWATSGQAGLSGLVRAATGG